MEYLLYPMPGDHEIIIENIAFLTTQTNEYLVDRYNKQVEIGIVGVRRQSLFLLALGKLMMARFNYSPIYLEQGYILGLKSKVKLEGNKLVHV